MRDVARRQWLGIAAIALVAALFAFFNAGEAVPVDLGLFVLYQVPLVVLIFIAFLLGMLAMFLAGLRHDMKVRALLRERGHDVPPAPPTRPELVRPALSARDEGYPGDSTRTIAPPAAPFKPYPPPDPEP